MNYRAIRSIIGRIMMVEAAFMLPALLISALRREGRVAFGFALTVGGLLAFGLPMALLKRDHKTYYAREGLIAVGLSWLTVSLFGALPFFLSGAIPSFVDCFFEAVSGFTTTGASVLDNVETLPRGLLYWRSFTHWLGGMGVLVFLLALAPASRETGESLHLLRAESPGVNVGKLVPRMHRSALILYEIYIAMTLLQIILLLLGKMPLFDAVTVALGTAGTGGFAIKNDSIASYGAYNQIVITVFMALFGVNFNVYYLLLLRHFRQAFKNEELWVYFGTFAVSSLVIAVNTLSLFGSFGTALHYSAFTAASVMSTTGYVTADWELWPQLSRTLLLLLMFMGASAGSTGGGLKVARILILLKSARRSIRRSLHPRAVGLVHMDGQALEDGTVHEVNTFTAIYFLLMAGFTLVLSLDGLDFETTFSSVVSCMNNIGPAMNLAGPTLNYSCYSGFGKLLLSFSMLFGRLELYPMLMLFTPSAWRK